MPGRSATTKDEIEALRKFLLQIVVTNGKTGDDKKKWLSKHLTRLYNEGNRANSCVLGGLPATLGLEVECIGFVAEPSPNGKRGKLKSFDLDSECWLVTLQDGIDLKAAVGNLRVAKEVLVPAMVEKPKQTEGAERKDGQCAYMRLHRQRLFEAAAREDSSWDSNAVRARAQQMGKEEFGMLTYSTQQELAAMEFGAAIRNRWTGQFEQNLTAPTDPDGEEEIELAGKPFHQLREGRRGGCRRQRCSDLRAAVELCAAGDVAANDVAESIVAILKDEEMVALHEILKKRKPVLDVCSNDTIWASVGHELANQCNNIPPTSSMQLPRILLSRAVRKAVPSWDRKRANSSLGLTLGRVCWNERSDEITAKRKRGRPFATYKKPDSVIKNHLKANSHASCRVSATGEVMCTLDKSKTRLGRLICIPKSTFCRRIVRHSAVVEKCLGVQFLIGRVIAIAARPDVRAPTCARVAEYVTLAIHPSARNVRP